ncbi:Signal transduction protein PmrD [Trichinella pseudospiralis]
MEFAPRALSKFGSSWQPFQQCAEAELTYSSYNTVSLSHLPSYINCENDERHEASRYISRIVVMNKPSPTANYTANRPLLHTLLLLPANSAGKDSTERSCRMSFLTSSDKSTFCPSLFPEQQLHICSNMKLNE